MEMRNRRVDSGLRKQWMHSQRDTARALYLRVHDDDVVGLGPLIETNVLDVLHANVRKRLLAAVEVDVQRTQRAVLARRGHVHVAHLVQAVAGRELFQG
jgi:hypothetical protein